MLTKFLRLSVGSNRSSRQRKGNKRSHRKSWYSTIEAEDIPPFKNPLPVSVLCFPFKMFWYEAICEISEITIYDQILASFCQNTQIVHGRALKRSKIQCSFRKSPARFAISGARMIIMHVKVEVTWSFTPCLLVLKIF
jgi:hypothetical protein